MYLLSFVNKLLQAHNTVMVHNVHQLTKSHITKPRASPAFHKTNKCHFFEAMHCRKLSYNIF